MILPLIVGCTLLAVSGDVSPPRPSDHDLKTYASAKAKARRDPDAHFRLALWCEAHGLKAERLRHLALTVLIDPDHAAARGLLGFVRDGDRWRKAKDVVDRARADEELAKKLAEYEARRAFLDEADRLGRWPQKGEEKADWPRNDYELGLWCEKNGLKAEATAHFYAATREGRHRVEAWHHLGFHRWEGRWVSDAQLAAIQAETTAQYAADKRWTPLLKKWRAELRGRGETLRSKAASALEEVDDPRAVAAIWRVFGGGDPEDLRTATRMLARIETPKSTRILSALAVQCDLVDVRDDAIAALDRREPGDYAEALVEQFHTPVTFAVTPVTGPGSTGKLTVDCPRFHLERGYDAPPPFTIGSLFYGFVGRDPFGMPVAIQGIEMSRLTREPTEEEIQDLHKYEMRTIMMILAAQQKAANARMQQALDVEFLRQMNGTFRITNQRAAAVLGQTLDAPNYGDDEDAWKRWWYDRVGYRYTPAPKVEMIQAVQQIPAPYLTTCFGAGTPVLTRDGPKAIEKVQVGDVVLSQDGATGALSYQPVVGLHHNPPDETLLVRLGDERIVASVYHRFWRPGKGWAMARELRPGDTVRTVAGPVRVGSVGCGDREPLYNLDVAGPATFFVGMAGALVHDNTLPDPRLKPFDAAPNLAP
ncbi:MAG TPA: polymorphic toxin-type HINT domain-containing protein [Isosphaeraceae bacterium]|jgi:hypothetical protein|nr:polymorphic toxin-type HINT domain-containing protein [Isosphaeraceae bacterium]